MPKARSAQYNTPGEPVKALTEIDAVWFSEEPNTAEGYMQPKWGRPKKPFEQGQLYEVTAKAERVAYIPETNDESVRSALTTNPQIIGLEDRGEFVVLDPSLIHIESITDEEGQEIPFAPMTGAGTTWHRVADTEPMVEPLSQRTKDRPPQRKSRVKKGGKGQGKVSLTVDTGQKAW